MMIKEKKKREFPNTFVIVFAAVVLAAVATWVIPGGEFVTAERPDGSSVTEYRSLPSEPQTWQVITALYNGFVKQAGVIAFILIIGGAFWVVNSVKAVDAGIFSFLRFTERVQRFRIMRRIGVGNVVLILIMLLFSLFGAVFGMSEEAIAFTALVIPLVVSMGYDSIVGVSVVYVASHVGFAGAMLNPFTVGVAQNMAGLPLFSGIGYRTVCWAVLTFIMILFVLWYASRIKKNPDRSVVYDSDKIWRDRREESRTAPDLLRTKASLWVYILSCVTVLLFALFYWDQCYLSVGNSSLYAPWLLPVVTAAYIVSGWFSYRKSVRFLVLDMLGFTILFLVIGVLCFSWYIGEISGLFLALGLFSGAAAGYSANRVVKEFLEGAKDIFSAALIVGLASGIIIILQEGKVIDSMLHSMEQLLDGSGKVTSLSLMYGIQTVLNLFIPSATAKAAITMPIMAPFSDMIELSRQATVLAFQFGDGFTNMITPTSGVLMAVLGMARIPYTKWVKFIWRFIIVLIIIGFLLLLPTVLMPLAGF